MQGHNPQKCPKIIFIITTINKLSRAKTVIFYTYKPERQFA